MTDTLPPLPEDGLYEWWLLGHPGWPGGLPLYGVTSDAEAVARYNDHPHPSAFVVRKVIIPTSTLVVPSDRYGDPFVKPLRCLQCDVEVQYRHVHDAEAHGWDGRS